MKDNHQLTKIIIVDDHQMFLDGLKALVSSINTVQLVGTFSDPRRAIDFVWSNPVDVAILDVSMPQMSGADFLKKIREIRPMVRSIVLSMHKDVKTVRKLVDLGANGYVLKGAEYAILKEAIDSVANGKNYFDAEVSDVMSSGFTPVLETQGRQITITKRELKILELLSEGLSSEEIADRLFISKHTVSTHRKNIGLKFETNRLVEILAKAREHGFI
ncbi:MAG: response regulator transcription factor [Flavobacteriales bacterium]|nr:response regulator transcription factor [Bacteroidota bacterium]MCB9241962.1 response regulator transcription factor [Flavobacteriales bacterium]